MGIQKSVSNINQKSFQLSGSLSLLRKSIEVIKKRLWTYLGIMIIPTILVCIAFIIIAIGGGFLIRSFNMSEFKWVLFPLSLALVITITIWPILAIFYTTQERDRNIGTFEALKRTLPKILPAFWLSWLINMIILIGSLFFIIPGLIFMKWFFLSMPVFLSENAGIIKSLSRSKKLMGEKTVLTRLMGFLIIGGLLGFVVTILLESDVTVINLIAGLIAIPIILVGNVFIFLFYEDLKKIEEGDHKKENQEQRNYQGI